MLFVVGAPRSFSTSEEGDARDSSLNFPTNKFNLLLAAIAATEGGMDSLIPFTTSGSLVDCVDRTSFLSGYVLGLLSNLRVLHTCDHNCSSREDVGHLKRREKVARCFEIL